MANSVGDHGVLARVPGGDITPEQLGVIARVAEKYNLYTKITGGQRIDLFGARVQDLPDIWEELVNAGFESGHAYAKALRTVKSCVGSTWCRYGVTADRLTRTSVWLEKLEGGIEHIRDVVVHDKLGIAAELEGITQHLVDTYECEWAAVVRDPEKRARFRQFVGSDESEPCIEFVSERGQSRPAYWPSDFVSPSAERLGTR